MGTEMCTGDFVEENIKNAGNDKQRPPAGTKCVEPCVEEAGRWGTSWCYTAVDQSQWGAECVQCQETITPASTDTPVTVKEFVYSHGIYCTPYTEVEWASVSEAKD